MIFENSLVKLEVEKSEIPWIKVFTTTNYKELSHCDYETKQEIFRVLDVVETTMLSFYTPTKINIASFGNYVPHVHFHIQARYKNDSYFPEPTWGKKQRESKLYINKSNFFKTVKNALEEQKLDK